MLHTLKTIKVMARPDGTLGGALDCRTSLIRRESFGYLFEYRRHLWVAIFFFCHYPARFHSALYILTWLAILSVRQVAWAAVN